MNRVDTFLRSVREAFKPEDDENHIALWIVVAAVVCALGAFLVQRLKARRIEKQAFARFLAKKQISESQRVLLMRLAARIHMPARTVATHIDVFERATAEELAACPPLTLVSPGGIFARLAGLRQALGFHNLPTHFPLLTTRELSAGVEVNVGGQPATIAEVNEAFLVVVLSGATGGITLGPGGQIGISMIHGREARYVITCAPLSRVVDAPGARLMLAHDEHPKRLQLRDAVRVPVAADTGVRIVLTGTSDEAESAPDTAAIEPKLFDGNLLDISVGGAALRTDSRLAVGAEVQLSFMLGDDGFDKLVALVLECEESGRGHFRLRLEFRPMNSSDEQKLAAAVARISAQSVARPEAHAYSR